MSKNKEKAGTGRKIVISLVVLLLLLTAGESELDSIAR